MKRLAIALLLALAATTFAAAEDSPVVKASKASTRKKAKPRRVITNADLAKPSNKPATQPKADSSVDVTAAAAPRTQDEVLRARHAAEAVVATAEKKVADLERELARVEQDYYEENDATIRDTVLTKRFAQTKQQLADARAAATDARDALAKLNKPRG